MKFIKDKRGSIAWLFLFLVVFLLVIGIIIEYGRAAAIKRNVEDGLSKALNSAVQMSMLDDYRQEHISRIDTDAASVEAYKYIAEVLGLSAPTYSMQGGEGRSLYRLEGIAISSVAEPPHMELSCTLVIPMAMFNSYTGGLELRIPLHIVSRNQRLD